MTAPFPNLLRRSSFVTHDPIITRVYTSNQSSTSRYGDWGLKAPLTTPKGPRYIKVNSLDAGVGIGADWRSAEREARLMAMWGDGRVPWVNSAEEKEQKYFAPSPKATLDSQSKSASLADRYAEPAVPSLEIAAHQRRTQWIPDVEIMTKKEFEKYLEEIRDNKPKYLERRLKELEDLGDKSPLALKEDRTIIRHTTSPLANMSQSSEFQAEITGEKLSSPGSTILHSKPHELFGLSYSRQPPSSIPLTPGSVHRGRALNQKSRAEVRTQQARTRSNHYNSGTNDAWIIGLGGLTANRSMDGNRTSDKPPISRFDYTRLEDKERGIAKFRIANAILKEPPKVFNVSDLVARNRWVSANGRRAESSDIQPNSQTFKFDIDVSDVDEEFLSKEVGSKEWVATEPVRAHTGIEGDLGAVHSILGGPRSGRIQGQGYAALDQDEKDRLERETKLETAARLKGILERFRVKNL